MVDLYETRENLGNILSLLTYQPNDGKIARAKMKIRKWLSELTIELHQFEEDMEKAAEEHENMKLMENGGWKL